MRDAAERRGLGHPPGVEDPDAELLLEALHQAGGQAEPPTAPAAARTCRAVRPACWSRPFRWSGRAGDGRSLGVDHPASGSGCRNRSGMSRSAPLRRRVRQPQALAWNIGTTGSTRSASTARRRARDCHRVQVDRAVAVHHALGVAGGAAGVAHRRGGARPGPASRRLAGWPASSASYSWTPLRQLRPAAPVARPAVTMMCRIVGGVRQHRGQQRHHAGSTMITGPRRGRRCRRLAGASRRFSVCSTAPIAGRPGRPPGARRCSTSGWRPAGRRRPPSVRSALASCAARAPSPA